MVSKNQEFSAADYKAESESSLSSIFPPPVNALLAKSHLKNFAEYQALYRESIDFPEAFWAKQAMSLLSWSRPFSKVLNGNLTDGNVSWFLDGELNVCYNCVDRHALKTPEKIAIIAEGDAVGAAKKISYSQLLDSVCRLANTLKALGVQRGDVVSIYLPMIPEAIVAMLACARIGAVHSVVFAGFSSDALRDRINDASCKILLTADQGKRGGKAIQLKSIVDQAISECPTIKNVLVFQHTGDKSVAMTAGRDLYWHEEVSKYRPYCPPTAMSSEDPLFLLYTSGSTGKPKGVMHTQAGYLLGATLSLKYTFDMHEGDVFGCVADVGWITGHSYIVYSPLSNGLTTVLFESIPTYPDAGRYWKLIDDHKITHFYTAPTAIRALKRLGDQWVTPYKLDTLRVIGTVGEPINPEAWMWYSTVVGKNKCAVVDTYWQTETGSFAIAPYASVVPTKPGAATFPQFGFAPVILDATTGQPITGNDATGVLCFSKPWPSMARSILNSHERYMDTYLKPYPGFYFTGDGVHRDKNGYYWIRGRVDDVINVSGHRLSTAEIESALVMNRYCAEAAVIGADDEITGQAIIAFCSLKPDAGLDHALIKTDLVQEVRKHIGPFSAPKKIIIVADLPKTRSGKIMRRILRKIYGNETDQLGDTSTLADPLVITAIIEACK